MLYAFQPLLGLKLCWHNRLKSISHCIHRISLPLILVLGFASDSCNNNDILLIVGYNYNILYIYKSETITNWFISYVTFCIDYWKFGNNRLINCLFGESAQHSNVRDVHKIKYLANLYLLCDTVNCVILEYQVHSYQATCINYNTGKSALPDIYARCPRVSEYISGKARVPVL